MFCRRLRVGSGTFSPRVTYNVGQRKKRLDDSVNDYGDGKIGEKSGGDHGGISWVGQGDGPGVC